LKNFPFFLFFFYNRGKVEKKKEKEKQIEKGGKRKRGKAERKKNTSEKQPEINRKPFDLNGIITFNDSLCSLIS